MTPKVRRGLGLLALVPLLFIADLLLFALAEWMNNPGGPPDWMGLIPLLIGVLAVIAALVALVVGLVLIALGLFRETSSS